MPHNSHRLKAYIADYRKPHVFCEHCGKEESEGLDQPCTKTFYQKEVDTIQSKTYDGFVSGLPEWV